MDALLNAIRDSPSDEEGGAGGGKKRSVKVSKPQDAHPRNVGRVRGRGVGVGWVGVDVRARAWWSRDVPACRND